MHKRRVEEGTMGEEGHLWIYTGTVFIVVWNCAEEAEDGADDGLFLILASVSSSSL